MVKFVMLFHIFFRDHSLFSIKFSFLRLLYDQMLAFGPIFLIVFVGLNFRLFFWTHPKWFGVSI